MSIPISVWFYNELLSTWSLKTTNHYQETKSEYNYFRVLFNGKKHFYHTAKDYFKHNENITPLNYQYKENDENDENNENNENDENNKSKIIEFTNIKGEVIYRY